MREAIKGAIKEAFSMAGLEIQGKTNYSSDAAIVNTLLRVKKIDLVLDVGANSGQFAEAVYKGGYHGRMVSFEPLGDAHRELETNAAKHPGWTVHPRCAVGAEPGQIEINVSGNSVSSSIRGMKAAHSESAPQSVYVAKEAVSLITLDSVYRQYARPGDRTYLKIDTQGFEDEVLKGAREALADVEVVQLELSLHELYEGQKLWLYFVEQLQRAGFGIWRLLPGFTNQDTGQLLQFDGIFYRQAPRETAPR